MQRLFVAFFLVTCSTALAQEGPDERVLVPDMAVKLSPLHLLNFYPTIEWSYEQRIRSRQTIQLEVGHVINFGTNLDVKFQNKRGVKLKLEGRHYFKRDRPARSIFYGAIEPYMNIINFDRDAVRQECFDVECSRRYNRRYYDKIKYREQGGSGKIGILVYLDTKYFFDFNAGITIRNIEYIKPERSTIGRGEDDTRNLFDIPNETSRVAASPSIGIRFGYRLR